ncbi:retrovirus-related pol polyprotein from transposon TNT 1-94 [Tanacetum coccineum]
MAQQIILAAQPVLKFQSIKRCNNYVMLQSIPCSTECKIVGQILLDHPFSYALTATTDVPAVYLQQFWKTIRKVPDTKDTIKIKLDRQEITYTIDMFRDTFHLPVETPKNPFIAPVNIKVIESFMQKFGYQGVVDKDFINYVFQKKDVIQYTCFTKLIIADLIKKFPSIPQRLDKDYHSIKDNIPLMSVYSTRNVLFRGMLIPDAFSTDEIHATTDYAEYETVFVKVAVPTIQPQPVVSTQGTHRTTPSAHRSPTFTAASPQEKKRKQIAGEISSPRKLLKVTIKQRQVVKGEQDKELYASELAASMLNDDVDDSGNRIEPGSHKESPKHVDDDDEKEKKDETKDEDKYNDDRIDHALVETQDMDSLENRTEKMQTPIPTPPRSLRISLSSDKNIKVYGKFDKVLHEIVSQLAKRATNDLIERNLKRVVADTIIQERDAFQAEVPALMSKEFAIHAPKIIEELFKNHVQNNVIQRKFEKSSTSNTSCKDDDFHSQNHDDYQDDDAPPDEEKRVKRHKTSKRSKSVRGSSSKQSAKESTSYVSKQQQQQEWDAWVEETNVDENKVIPEDETSELIAEFQNVDKHILTIFDQSTNYMENQIVWESRQEYIRRSKSRALIFYRPQRNPNEPPSMTGYRLGHPADRLLNVLETSLQIGNKDQTEFSEIYQRANQTREPFPLSYHTSSNLGNLVHLDLWDLYKTECILTVTHLINKLPSSVLNGKFLYEMIYKKSPTLSHLRVFGCLCFAAIVNNNDKFGSRDVKFFEFVFPFKDSVSKKQDTQNVFQDLNHIIFFDIEYPKMPNNDERVDPSMNSDQRSQGDSSHSSMPGNLLKTDAMKMKWMSYLEMILWEITDLPKDRKAIGSKWVFKIKYKSKGEIDRYKARLVVKCFNKKEGVDFEETFSHVVKIVTVRCLLNLVVFNCWPAFQLDVNNAFLYGDLVEIVYMKPLEGYFLAGENKYENPRFQSQFRDDTKRASEEYSTPKILSLSDPIAQICNTFCLSLILNITTLHQSHAQFHERQSTDPGRQVNNSLQTGSHIRNSIGEEFVGLARMKTKKGDTSCHLAEPTSLLAANRTIKKMRRNHRSLSFKPLRRIGRMMARKNKLTLRRIPLCDSDEEGGRSDRRRKFLGEQRRRDWHVYPLFLDS